MPIVLLNFVSNRDLKKPPLTYLFKNPHSTVILSINQRYDIIIVRFLVLIFRYEQERFVTLIKQKDKMLNL